MREKILIAVLKMLTAIINRLAKLIERFTRKRSAGGVRWPA